MPGAGSPAYLALVFGRVLGGRGYGAKMRTLDRPGLVMAAVGGLAIVVGGLVAAVTGPLALAKGSWLAAYLVLVVGVGQVALGAARILGPRGTRHGWVLFAMWLFGNVHVMVGTLRRESWMVDVGGVACVVALVFALLHSRHLPNGLVVWAYRGLLLLMLLSVPVGLMLSHLRTA